VVYCLAIEITAAGCLAISSCLTRRALASAGLDDAGGREDQRRVAQTGFRDSMSKMEAHVVALALVESHQRQIPRHFQPELDPISSTRAAQTPRKNDRCRPIPGI